MKVKFIKNPIVFMLAYNEGDVVTIEAKQAAELIEAGVAEAVEEIETATEKTPIENAAKRTKK